MPENTLTNENGKISNEEKLSPFDWEAFGFKVFDKDRDSLILDESPLMLSILDYISENGEGNMTLEEFTLYKGDIRIQELLEKLICIHRSEWAYSDGAFTNMRKEIEKYYDNQIKILNPENENARTQAEEKRNEDLELFENKVKNLTFLEQIKLDINSTLPQNYFYFFHPKAFVKQMEKMQIIDYSKYVRFASSIETERRSIVSQKSIQLLGYIAFLTEMSYITITSTIRYPRTQAIAMYYSPNIKYKAPGEAVKAVYRECKKQKLSKEATIDKMTQKIEELSRQNQRVSLHCVSIDEYKKLNVIDVSYQGIGDKEKYIKLLEANDDVKKIIHSVEMIKNTSKIFYDKGEPCIHVEIKQ